MLINWNLIFAPRKVLEYVVAHELAHLHHRSHGRDFWDCVATLVPGCEAMKAWLDKHQSGLSADFLAGALHGHPTITVGAKPRDEQFVEP